MGSYLFAGAAAILLATSSHVRLGAQDEPNDRVLDPVITESTKPEKDAPKTGRLLVRPILLQRHKRAPSNVTGVDLIFTAIEETESGEIVRFGDQNRTRYRMVVPLPLVRLQSISSRLPVRRSADDYETRQISLPGGTYILSEIRYQIAEIRRGQLFLTDQRELNFCLSKRSISFDIQNGTDAYLGAIAISSLSPNPAHRRNHVPIMAIDPNPDLMIGSVVRDIEAIELPLSTVTFDPDDGICSDRGFQSVGWREN
ncbi:MAG: hypothetical protein AAFQ84_07135 [Pseudomonadota bacterium]